VRSRSAGQVRSSRGAPRPWTVLPGVLFLETLVRVSPIESREPSLWVGMMERVRRAWRLLKCPPLLSHLYLS
jgi:hypothetical protein